MNIKAQLAEALADVEEATKGLYQFQWFAKSLSGLLEIGYLPGPVSRAITAWNASTRAQQKIKAIIAELDADG
jgi:hypothetical protein